MTADFTENSNDAVGRAGGRIDRNYRCDREIKRQENWEIAIFLSVNVSVGSAGYVCWQLIRAHAVWWSDEDESGLAIGMALSPVHATWQH